MRFTYKKEKKKKTYLIAFCGARTNIPGDGEVIQNNRTLHRLEHLYVDSPVSCFIHISTTLVDAEYTIGICEYLETSEVSHL